MLRFPALGSALPNDGHYQIARMFDEVVEEREFRGGHCDANPQASKANLGAAVREF
jgi:hypothetical protein